MKYNNRPAFPLPIVANDNGIYTTFDAREGDELGGLSKREYFAGKAMLGILSNGNYDIETTSAEIIARDSVSIADALLAELEKTHST
jgi:hypothetical protein